jgi:hypothetical protein
LKTTPKQRGGVTGRGFLPGQSGNPGGRPRSERTLLERLYGEDGEQVYQRLEALRQHPKTPAKLKAQIDFFIIERFHGRAQQRVEVEGGASLLEVLAAASARIES